MSTRARVLTVLVCLSGTGPIAVGAQTAEQCEPTLTIEQCFERLRTNGNIERGAREVKAETEKATTGAQTTGGTGTTSSIQDFLPRFVGALLTPGLDVDSQALALRYNLRAGPAPLQLGVELSRAKLLPGLADSIPETIRDSSLSRLEDELDDEDDLRLSAAINIERDDLGRSLVPHLQFISEIVRGLVGPTRTLALVDSLTDLAPFLPGARDAARATASECTGETQNWQLDCFRSGFLADTLLPVIEGAASELASAEAVRIERLRTSNLEVFAMLLNNQPQLNFAVTRHLRGDLVGADEWIVYGRLELGVANNLNWLRSRCDTQLPAAATESDPARWARVSRCFQRVTSTPEAREQLERSRRFWAQLDYTLRDEFSLRLVTDSVDIDLPRSSELKLGLGYGQYFGSLEDVARRPRIDIEANFEKQVTGDERNDRFVAKLTYTRPFTDDLGAAIGFVWANKPEYVGDVTRRVGARLGLTYKLLGGDG